MEKEQGKKIFRELIQNLNKGEEHEARKGVDSKWNRPVPGKRKCNVAEERPMNKEDWALVESMKNKANP